MHIQCCNLHYVPAHVQLHIYSLINTGLIQILTTGLQYDCTIQYEMCTQKLK